MKSLSFLSTLSFLLLLSHPLHCQYSLNFPLTVLIRATEINSSEVTATIRKLVFNSCTTTFSNTRLLTTYASGLMYAPAVTIGATGLTILWVSHNSSSLL